MFKKIIIITTSIIILSASLALSVSAAVSSIRLDWASGNAAVTSMIRPTVTTGLELSETSTDQTVINPFIERSFAVNGDLTNTYTDTLITESFDKYGQALYSATIPREDGDFVRYGEMILYSDSFSSEGSFNTVTIDICLPVVEYSGYDDIANWDYKISLLSSGVATTLDCETSIVASDPYVYSDMVGAPALSVFFRTYRMMFYFDGSVSVSSGDSVSIVLPLAAYAFQQAYSFTEGIVFGYNFLEIDFYESLQEAQNEIIINALTKFPNKVKYESAIEENESLAVEMEKVEQFEQSMYDLIELPTGFDQDSAVKVDNVFDGISFIWDYPWVTTLILTGISLALLSYALFGGT